MSVTSEILRKNLSLVLADFGDLQTAFDHLSRDAFEGNAEAQYRLGEFFQMEDVDLMLTNGYGEAVLIPNPDKALECFELAAAKGHIEAIKVL